MVEVRPRKAWGESNPQSLSDAAGNGPAQQLLTEAAAGGPISTPPCTGLGTAPTVLATMVVDPRGNPTAHRFNSNGYLIAQTDALGQTTQFERANGTNLLLSTTDPLGRVTRFTYDANGNVTSFTDPVGNVRTFTYDPTFNRVTSITDSLGNVTTFEYDAQGNLIAVTDPLQNTKPEAERLKTRIAYNPFGQPISTTDPLGNVTQFEYDAEGNLIRIIDPLGNTTARTYDGVSRLILQTDPRGKSTRFGYDLLNRLVTIVDPLNAVTAFTYDENANLLTVTDAKGATLAHSYDVMDRLATRTDPLGRQETFTYDGVGSLVTTTDRKGQTTTVTYGPLNRRTQATYADGQTATFTYDPAGRLLQATDTADPHGPILLTYDALDRLVSEITALGTVSYQYDPLGRRTQMTVSGQPPVAYTYDANSRLRTIAQEPLAPVTIDYDPLGRRILLTLPNGVSTEYQYDAASRLTALIYRNTIGVLGNLSYRYDGAGNRIGVGGTFARTLLPDPIPSATYDGANQQLQFGAKTMTFDANGNLVSITGPTGTTTFTWNAQNRLISLIGPGITASFTYDALGRRSRKTINGLPTDYLYDGVNPLQELSEGNKVTNLLTGLGVDEYFVRTNSTGTDYFLGQALGTALALTDSAATLRTEYTYEPFGRTDASGLSSTNPFQYTGRENDGTGLYYYRARYYTPRLRRFISEDPLGVMGGDTNLYAYVRNDPLEFIDPLGMYLSYVHGFITFVSMVSKGYDPYTASFVAGTNMGADFIRGSQRAENANWHAMATPEQSPSEAEAATEQLIQSWLDPTGNPLVDYVNLGRALHASDDKFPGGHEGFQAWPGRFPSREKMWEHIIDDAIPSLRDLIDAVRAQRELIDRWEKLRRRSQKKG